MNEISELFDEVIAASNAYEVALDAVSDFIEANEKPTFKKSYESYDDYAKDVSAKNEYLLKLEQLQAERSLAADRIKQLEAKLRKLIPQETWFKHGDVGIGLGFSNWGGNHTYVVVKPWQEKMPSLDHRYRGD